MNVLQALRSFPFWAYTLTAALVLGACGGALFWFGRRKLQLQDWWLLFWSWALFVATVSAAVLLGREVFALVVALVCLFACKEFARATGLYEDWLFTGTVYLAILAVNVTAQLLGYDLFMASPIYAVAALCVLPVARNRSEGMLQRVALSVMAFVYFGFFLAHLSLLAGIPDPGKVYAYLLFMLYGTATADLAGWLAGRWLGKHALLPRIDPDLTRERAGATVAWAFVWSLVVGQSLPDAVGWPALFLAGFLLGVMGPLGDLVMRCIFRDLGLKPLTETSDYAPYLALGHLHRLIFVAPLFFRLVHWFDPDVLVTGAPAVPPSPPPAAE